MYWIKQFTALLCGLLLIPFFVSAQEFGEYNDMGYNQNSLRPVHKSQIMYQKTQWRRVLLNEKMNRPFFAKNAELPRLLIEAAKQGYIKPYTSDSLTRHMATDEFLKRLQMEDESGSLSDVELEIAESFEDEWDTDGVWDTDATEEVVSNEYFPSDLKILEVKEHVFFDKKHSRMKRDIQAITIVIPAELRLNGIETQLATFSYKEIVENLFRDNPETLWYNSHNTRNHINLEQAFDLSLMDGWIVKYSNGENLYIQDLHEVEGVDMLVQEMRYAHHELEYENNLWEN